MQLHLWGVSEKKESVFLFVCFFFRRILENSIFSKCGFFWEKSVFRTYAAAGSIKTFFFEFFKKFIFLECFSDFCRCFFFGNVFSEKQCFLCFSDLCSCKNHFFCFFFSPKCFKKNVFFWSVFLIFAAAFLGNECFWKKRKCFLFFFCWTF